jgi:REP element-mobilizing transposase RayT
LAALPALIVRSQEAFGLCVLDYMVTSNHVHLLVKDTGPEVIAQSMQLIAGRTAQEFGVNEIGMHGGLNGQTDIWIRNWYKINSSPWISSRIAI